MITPRTRASKQEREASILELLSQGPCTKFDITKATGITTKGFYHYRRSLKGKIYVQGWTIPQPGWPNTPVYALGDLPDVPRPVSEKTEGRRKYRAKRKAKEEEKRKSLDRVKENMRRYRQRLKEQGISPRTYQSPNKRKRTREPEATVVDPWISAFFSSTGGSR